MRLIKSFGYALQGIAACMRGEKNFQLQLLAAVLALLLGWWLNISATEWLLVTICIGSVLSAEMFNSALEKLCNRITTGPDAAIKSVKDISAGAVLVLALASAVVGACIFVPKFMQLPY